MICNFRSCLTVTTGIILCLISSCEYEPKGIYNRSVEEESTTPDLQVVELNLTSDTIYLFSGKNIKFSFASKDLIINSVVFYIDSKYYVSVLSSAGSFNLDPVTLTEGPHLLKLLIIAQSKNPSIANFYGGITYESSKTWVIIIDNNFRTGITTDYSNGLLHLSWKKYPNNDLSRYVLYRCEVGGELNKKEIAQLTVNEFIDSTYVGEQIRFEVIVETNDDLKIDWSHKEMPQGIPEISIHVDSNNKYYLSWGKSHYWKAVKSYNLSYIVTGGKVPLKTTDNPVDTIYQINSILVDIFELKLHLVPQKEKYYDSHYFSFFESRLPNPVFGQSFSLYGPYYSLNPSGADEFVVNTPFTLYKYSIPKNRFVEKLESSSLPGCNNCLFNSVTTSSSGKNIGIFIPGPKPFCLVNSSDLSDKLLTNINITDNYYNLFPISDIGTGPINSNTVPGRFYLYNYKTSSILDTLESLNPESRAIKISLGGDYFFLKDDSLRLAQWTNSHIEVVHTFKTYPKYFEFSGIYPNQVVIWEGETVSVRRCSDFSIINEYTIPYYGSILNVDFYNNEFLRYSSGHFYIHSFADGSIIHDIKTNALQWYGYNSCYLIGHRIVFLNGVLFNVDNF